MLSPLKDRHAQPIAALEALREHNRRVRSGEAVTKEEIAAERKRNTALTKAANRITPDQTAAVLAPDAPESTPDTFTPEQVANLFGQLNQD